MALRLTTTSLPPQAPPSARSALIALTARAGAALVERRFDRYRDCFTQAQAIEDLQRRYQGRKLLIEQGFATCARVPRARAPEILIATATAAIDILAENPAEPVLLNYAAVALYELWSLDAAQALFAAAQRLDPSLPHTRRNIAECKRRKRSAGGPTRQLQGVSSQLVRRARSVAERARPAKGLTLSLCMIVRDEEDMLARCLEAAAPAVDEIVVVDTGSQDRTIEIARSFGARVIEREWTGSFADARNVSFEQATGDWLLYLDADEILVKEDAQRLRALTGQTWRECFYLVETNFTGGEDDGTAVNFSALRMFRNRPHYRFSGRLHEQIGQHMPSYVPERIHHSNVRVEHYGYLGAVRDAKAKSRRNIELLLAQRAESPPNAFLHFNLGSEYAAAGDGSAALQEFEQAWAMVKAQGPSIVEFAPILVCRLVKALHVCGRPQDAIDLAVEGLALYPRYTDLVFEQGSAVLTLGRSEDAVAYFRLCIEMGDAPAPYTASVGCGTYLPRIALADMHVRNGELADALELLRWCADKHPEFFGLILPYAAALLSAGHSSESVVAEIERCVPRVTPTVRFLLGTALFEAGAGPAAENQFRLVLTSQPHSGQARIALSEVLLYQRLYGEGAAQAALIDEDSPFAKIAARSALFGWTLADDFERARDALAQAQRVGMPSAELSVFRSWLAGRAGDPPVGSVPHAAWTLLEPMLESLLRVQDFENFETLLPVLAASELPVREQRELLGRIYLRRGFLRSSAREWMAVVSEAPDVRALVGLARVSLANGQTRPAETFAARALALDPKCAAALAILDSSRSAEVAFAS
ncbi:MAG: glycosyltransferase [Solirubrobacteraceae bacterium]